MHFTGFEAGLLVGILVGLVGPLGVSKLKDLISKA
jgi:hypothetical protein